jgi:hypothetical protein
MEDQPPPSLEEQLTPLREKISGPHKSIPFVERLREIVATTVSIPDSGPYIGVMKSDSGGLWIRSNSLGPFLRLRPNSVTKNLSQLGFRRDKGNKAATEIRRLLQDRTESVRKWSLWQNTVCRFNEETPNYKLKQLTSRARIARRTTNSSDELSASDAQSPLPQSSSFTETPPTARETQSVPSAQCLWDQPSTNEAEVEGFMDTFNCFSGDFWEQEDGYLSFEQGIK